MIEDEILNCVVLLGRAGSVDLETASEHSRLTHLDGLRNAVERLRGALDGVTKTSTYVLEQAAGEIARLTAKEAGSEE